MSISAFGQDSDARLERPRILCVDDEPQILESLRDTLHRRFDVCSATTGAGGLEQLGAEPEAFSVVLSDMRMPVMPGSVFLGEALKLAPDAAQILLTGYADIQSAISAVNNGQLFRFLTKPCAAGDLLAACLAGVEQHRLKTAEHVLLEQTLKGSVKALSEVLALANPAAFGRSSSVRTYAKRLASALRVDGGWEIEVAALLAQLGAVTLPPDTVEKRYTGAKLSAREQQMVDRVPHVTHEILANIPRLDGVLDILQSYPRSYDDRGAGRSVPLGARIVRIAIDYDALVAHGLGPAIALATLRDRDLTYDPDLLAAFERTIGTSPDQTRVLEIPLLRLRPGMTLADDVRSVSGPLLIARGHVATDQLITRLWNLGPGFVREPLLVIDTCSGVTDRHPHATGEPLFTDARRRGAAAGDAGQRYREVLALSADMLTAHDEDGRYSYVSPACEQIYGRAPEELIGRHPLEFVHEDDRGRVEQEIARAVAARGVFEFEHRVLRPDGTCAWVHVVIRMGTASPGEGRRIGAVGSVRDITERKHAQAQYDAERRLLNVFLESTPDQVYFKDRDGRFIRVSNAQVAKLGFGSAQDAIGKTDFDAFSEEHAGQAYADEQRILASGEPILDLEERETYPDGTEAWVRTSKLPLRDAAGQVVGTFGISRDITAQRTAEEALNKTERELRTVLELSGDLHVRTDADGRLLYVSPNSARVIGWTPEQLLGTRTHDYAHPHDAARLHATYREVAETGSAEVEYRVRRPDGTYTWLHVLARGRRDEDGNLVEVVRAARNIDQQKRQETQLVEATMRFERAFDQAPIGMALVGLDGSWLKVNPALCQITGYSEAELLHKRFGDITHPDDRQAGIEHLEGQRRSELDIYEAEKRYIHADGHVIWVTLSASIVRDEHGRALYAVSQTQDITAAKQAAAERGRLEAELQLAQKLEAVGQLAAGVAHEINTPIQFVGDSVRFLKGAVDELLTLTSVYRDLLQGEQAIDRAQRLQRAAAAEQESDLGYLIERVPPAFERAVDGIDRVASIVQAMRQFAHPGAERGPTDINDGIRATLTVAVNEYKYVADIELDLGELPLVTANAGDLNQVFLNLIVNGAHAIESKLEDSGQRGTIRISTRVDGEHVLITFSDTGCGIPPAIAARVFDPFFTTKPVGRGTGQGLAIAHTIVAERHHGAISFKSAPGGGTTFEITLPIDEPAPPSTAGCSEL